jgi:hypothetical protein
MSQTQLFPSEKAFEKHGMKISYKRKNMHGSCPICLEDFTCTTPHYSHALHHLPLHPQFSQQVFDRLA